MRREKKKHWKGLTLIESIVSVSTIAFMFAVSVPSLEANKELARRVVCANNLKSQGQGVFIYANSHDQTLPKGQYEAGDDFGTGTTTGSIPVYSYVMFYLRSGYSIDQLLLISPKDRINTDFPNGGAWGLGELFMNDIIREGETFYCPSSLYPFRYEDYSYNGTTFPFYDMSSSNPYRVRSSYNYVPQAFGTEIQITGSGTGYFPETATKVSQLHASQVMTCDLIYSLDYLSHKEGSNEPGLNGLFGDGSVRFKNDPEIFASALWGRETFPRNIAGDEYVFRTIISLLEND